MKPLTRKEAIINGDDITPVNRQEYWLKQMGGGSGGGGGALVVTTLSTGTGQEQLDKTWQEIYNAVSNGTGVMIRSLDDEYATIKYLHEVYFGGGHYSVDVLYFNGANLANQIFTTDSASGKPIFGGK